MTDTFSTKKFHQKDCLSFPYCFETDCEKSENCSVYEGTWDECRCAECMDESPKICLCKKCDINEFCSEWKQDCLFSEENKA